MPLNIDWQQILLHLLNVTILFAVLYFLLYSPVKKFMKRREEHYSELERRAQAKLEEAEKAAEGEPLLRLLPWELQTAGMITTGSEVEKGLIKDQFSPVVKKKLSDFQIEVTDHRLCGDDMARITAAILDMKKAGLDLIVCTGGMSVDPDDRTPGAIKASGAKIVTYGAPVLPGAMLCLGYFDDGTPVSGLPGCVMYAKATIFDLLLPRLAAGVKMERRDIVRMGHGGLCLGCGECHYPVCPFGKQG